MMLQKKFFYHRQINMLTMTKFLLLFITFKIIVCSNYNGIMFPSDYLKTEEVSTEEDLVYYLDRLRRIMNILMVRLNATEGNEIFGSYFCSATLKRTLQDYGSKLQKYSHEIKQIARDGDDVISHFNYFIKYGPCPFGTCSEGYKSTTFPLADNTGLVYSMGSFRRNAVEKFINEDEQLKLNDFIQSMDELNLSKEKYTELCELGHNEDHYGINFHVSDECLNGLIEDIDPHDYSVMRSCKYNARCFKGVFQTPSVAYGLSHRMLLQFMYFTNRRCYLRSPELDLEHLDKLCAAMYRETVYLARRGYFFRDLFMEHIGLCGMLGYEEFHRRRWFRKTASWVQDDGCIQENVNFLVNRSKIKMADAVDAEHRAILLADLYSLIDSKCHRHQQAVAMMVLSNAIRHTAHYL